MMRRFKILKDTVPIANACFFPNGYIAAQFNGDSLEVFTSYIKLINYLQKHNLFKTAKVSWVDEKDSAEKTY